MCMCVCVQVLRKELQESEQREMVLKKQLDGQGREKERYVISETHISFHFHHHLSGCSKMLI